MTFNEKIINYQKSIKEKLPHIDNEETTKTALIFPFLSLMGYDITNPAEVKTEYTADMGAKQGEKVDIAILDGSKVNILIECKSKDITLDETYISQLYRYFNITDSEIGILTNGLTYKFYTDSQKKGLMDKTPFLEFNIQNISNSKIKELERFTKENFDIDNILKRVDDLKYSHDVHEVLSDEIASPSDEFVKVIAKQVYDGVLTKNVKEKFYKIIKNEFNKVILEEVDIRLNQALENNDDEIKETELIEEPKKDGIVTTKEELEGFFIVKSICSEIVDTDRIVFRDHKTYSAALFDDNNLYPVCRFYFNDLNRLQIGFFDDFNKDNKGRKNVNKTYIGDLKEIYNYKEKIIRTVNHYKKIKK